MMPVSAFGPNQKILTHEHVYDLTQTVLNENFDGFEINGYKYSHNEIWDVLLYASTNGVSIKTSCESLVDAPSYNWVYTMLNTKLFESYSLDELEQQGNDTLKDTFPKRLEKSPLKLALDLVLIPYYGDRPLVVCLTQQ